MKMYYLGTFSMGTLDRVLVFCSAEEAWQAALNLPPTHAWPLDRSRALRWLLQTDRDAKAESILQDAESRARSATSKS